MIVPRERFSRVMGLAAACLLMCGTQLVVGQTMYFGQGDKHQQFLERLEMKLQRNPEFNLTSIKQISRHVAVDAAGLQDSSSGNPSIKLSKVDQQNLQSLLMNSAEYVTRESRKRTFYRNPANLIETNRSKFFFALNPVLQVQQSYEQDNDDPVHLYSAGLTMRALLSDKVGFYFYGTKNLETPPLFVQDRVGLFRAVPGAGKWTPYNDRGYDYYDLRGGITFRALSRLDFQIAYDRNFIGNGYRSLFMSDNGNSNLFFKMNTRFWKIRYQHLYSALTPQFPEQHWTGEYPFGRKVVAMHHLTLNATKWLTVGIFQAIIINERNDYPYLYPLMFLPITQLTNKNPANDLAGLDFKANVAKRHQLYGQFVMDQFILKDVTKGEGKWNNRFGVQLGGKTTDLFGISNLDLQLEMNMVRPFTYSANDSSSNYSHYNQPLAHPLGANFVEGIAILRYQPIKKLNFSARAIFWQQGIDSGQVNFGGNIFKPNSTRVSEVGYTIPTGVQGNGLNAQFLASYEILENVFVDASALIRNWKSDELPDVNRNTSVYTIGVRMNMFRREYDY